VRSDRYLLHSETTGNDERVPGVSVLVIATDYDSQMMKSDVVALLIGRKGR